RHFKVRDIALFCRAPPSVDIGYLANPSGRNPPAVEAVLVRLQLHGRTPCCGNSNRPGPYPGDLRSSRRQGTVHCNRRCSSTEERRPVTPEVAGSAPAGGGTSSAADLPPVLRNLV